MQWPAGRAGLTNDTERIGPKSRSAVHRRTRYRKRVMKKKMTQAALEHFVLAEIAQSRRCPKGLRIHIEARADGRWNVVPLDQNLDQGCIKRVAAITARFHVDFELIEDEAPT